MPRRNPELLFSALEPRLVLASVAWDGGGDGVSWNDPVNWDADVLPVDGDDVTISDAADPVITYTTGTVSLLSLTTEEDLLVMNGSLGVTGSADINATLSLQGGEIRGGAWDVTGGKLEPRPNSNNRITDAAISGDITLDVGSGRVQILGTTTFDRARLAASSTALGFEGGATLPGEVVFEGAATGTRALTMVSPGSLTIPSGMTLGSSAFDGSVQLGGSFFWSQAQDLIVEGEINIESGSNRVVNFRGATVVNTGTITTTVVRVDMGPGSFDNQGAIVSLGSDIALDNDWSNASGMIEITDGDLDLEGAFTTADLGTITRMGTTSVEVRGSLDNTGDVLAFDASTGSWLLQAGSVTGGQLTSADGERLRIGTSTTNQLVDVTVVGDLVLDFTSGRVQIRGATTFDTARLAANSTGLGFEGGSSLPGDIVFEGSATGTRALTMVSPGTFTIPSGVTVGSSGFDGSAQIGGSFYWNQSQDLIVEGEIDVQSGGARTLDFRGTTVVNHGTITGTSLNVVFRAGSLDNQSTIVSLGAHVTLDNDWTNAMGMIDLVDGELDLDGDFVTADVGTILRTGTPLIRLIGALDNTGDSLAFDASSGSWRLQGGSVTGGQMTSADGEKLQIGTNSNNRLIDVTVVGDLVLDITSGRVQILGSTTFDTARLAASSTGLGFEGGTTLSGDVVFEGGATGTRALTMTSAGSLTVPVGVSVTSSGFDGSVQIGGSFYWNQAQDLVVEGAIDIESGAARLLDFRSSTIVNTGTITATAMNLRFFAPAFDNQGEVVSHEATVTLDNGWSNTSGTITLNDGDLNLDGAFTTADVGTITRVGTTLIQLVGALDNTGDVLAFGAATGSWRLQAGVVTGGQMTSADGETLVIGASSNNRLIDLQIVGDLLVNTTSARVQILGTTTFDRARLGANSTALGFEGNTTLPGDVVFEGSATGTRALTMISPGSLTVPVGVTVGSEAFNGQVQVGGSFYWNQVQDLVVEGEIDIESSAGRLVDFRSTSLVNTGTITVAAATGIMRPGTLDNHGVIRIEEGGLFRVDLGVPFENEGTLAAGPDSTVRVESDLTQSASATLLIEVNGVAGPENIGRIEVQGVLALAGTMRVVGVDGWTVDCVNLECVTADSITGAFDTLDLPDVGEDFQAFVIFTPDGQSIRFAASPLSDWNSDGVVDTIDFLEFLNDWVAGEPGSDFNGDGSINTLDFIAFLNSWTTYC